jgi:hypothetical protein
VTVCEQTMGKWLRQLGMTRLQPRPYHPKKDLEAEVASKKTGSSLFGMGSNDLSLEA